CAQRRLAHRLLLDERAGGPAALENVRGRGRREGELRPLVGFDHPVADRDRESVGVSLQAPHPKAALLGANFLLSREAEQFLTTRGRMPTRHDVPINPTYV